MHKIKITENIKVKSIMTEDEAERLYRKELAEGTINTEEEGVPYYDSLNEYIRMLEDMGVKIKQKKEVK